jgi:hypothetical protein
MMQTPEKREERSVKRDAFPLPPSPYGRPGGTAVHEAQAHRVETDSRSHARAGDGGSLAPVSSGPRYLGWISPLFWMVPSLTLFCVCLVFPPMIYTDLIGDQDFVFLNWRTFVFTALCVMSVLAGMAAFSRVAPPSKPEGSLDDAPPLLTDIAMGVVLVMGNLYVLRVIQQSGLFSSFFETVRGDADFSIHYYATIETLDPANLASISLASVAFLPWLYHVRLNARGRLKTHESLVLVAVFWGLFLSYAATVAPLGRRHELLRPIMGVFLVWFLHQCLRGRMTRTRLLAIFSAFVACGLGLFVIVWLGRTGGMSGNIDTLDLWTQLVGYLIGPYNQQAALIDGTLVFEGTGKGYNWSQWFWKFPILQNFLVPEDFLGALPPYGVYERLEVLEANGFERRFTALSAFGNSFVDFRWLGFLPFIPYGFVGAWIWRQFATGRPAGVIIYPMFAYSILEWRANLLFPPPYFVQILLIVLAVVIGRHCELALRRR